MVHFREFKSLAARQEEHLKRLVSKRTTSPLSWPLWLYQYANLRLLITILICYGALTAEFTMLDCEQDGPYRDHAGFADLVCTFNNTFVLRHPTLDPFWERADLFTAGFRHALQRESKHSVREYLYYYLHIFFILAVLIILNGASEILSHYWLGARSAFFACHRHNCAKSSGIGRFVCLAHKLRDAQHHRYWTGYFWAAYVTAEVVPLATILAAFCFLDFWFGGRYINLGFDIARYYSGGDRAGMPEPIRYMFPLIAKCESSYFSEAGDWRVYDAFCMLNLNYANQFVFPFLWFWYAFLACCFITSTAAKLVLLICGQLRCWYLAWVFKIKHIQVANPLTDAQFVMLSYNQKLANRKVARGITIALQRDDFWSWFEMPGEPFPYDEAQIKKLLCEGCPEGCEARSSDKDVLEVVQHK